MCAIRGYSLWGGAYLIYLGIEHLGAAGGENGDEVHNGPRVSESPQFWHVVVLVELADLVFSLDNVVAAVALADHIVVVLIGVALGILALRWAASYFALAVEKEPVLQDAAYLLVLVIGLRFCIEQVVEFEIPPTLQFVISLSILGLALLYAHWRPMQVLHPLVHRVRRGLFIGLESTKYVLSLRWLRVRSAQEPES